MTPRDSSERRIRREVKTIRAMIAIYCRAHHGSGGLCDECTAVFEYARQRVDRCPFCVDKPTCLNCTVHCFKPDMRERTRVIMRYAGPRMWWRHPILTLFHFADGRRPPSPGQ